MNALPVIAAEHLDAKLPLNGGGIRTEQRMHSWKALQQDGVVMQKMDYSCGAAALATVFQHYFADRIDEAMVLADILNSLSADEVAEREHNGLSLLDLKQYALRHGYQAVGVRLKFAGLTMLQGPVLIHLEHQGVGHFAVLKGIRGDRVFLADPSRGNVRLAVERFAADWTGVALVLGKSGFATPAAQTLALSERAELRDELLAAFRVLTAAQ
jgi:predicted double-glycine peptidase